MFLVMLNLHLLLYNVPCIQICNDNSNNNDNNDIEDIEDNEYNEYNEDIDEDSGDEEDVAEGPPRKEGLEQDHAHPRHHRAHNRRVRIVVGVVKGRPARHACCVRRKPEVLPCMPGKRAAE